MVIGGKGMLFCRQTAFIALNKSTHFIGNPLASIAFRPYLCEGHDGRDTRGKTKERKEGTGSIRPLAA